MKTTEAVKLKDIFLILLQAMITKYSYSNTCIAYPPSALSIWVYYKRELTISIRYIVVCHEVHNSIVVITKLAFLFLTLKMNWYLSTYLTAYLITFVFCRSLMYSNHKMIDNQISEKKNWRWEKLSFTFCCRYLTC